MGTLSDENAQMEENARLASALAESECHRYALLQRMEESQLAAVAESEQLRAEIEALKTENDRLRNLFAAIDATDQRFSVCSATRNSMPMHATDSQIFEEDM